MSSSIRIRHSVSDRSNQMVEVDGNDLTRITRSAEIFVDATSLPTLLLTLETTAMTLDIEEGTLKLKDIIIPEFLKRTIYEFLKDIYEKPPQIQ